jgi:hypothetical protein
MIRIILSFLFLLFLAGCAGISKVKYSQTQISQAKEAANFGTDGKESLTTLIRMMRGTRFGNRIFNRSTSALWIIPEIHRIDLDLTARQENFSQEEYERRLERLRELHTKYLVFYVDLRMPLNPRWTQDELTNFLKENLVVTLENGSKSYFPEKTIFRTVERFQEEELKDFLMGYRKDLEVSITMRAFFARGQDEDQIINPSTSKIVLKLQLKYPPPYNIGYFDENFFQGYMWKLVH